MNKAQIIEYLNYSKSEALKLFELARATKLKYVGDKVFLRGIIEFSNICIKNCYYCGIRRDNKKLKRYTLTDKEIITSALYAYKNKMGSIVLQSGERKDKNFVNKITFLIKEIKNKTNGNLGITLSLGEQDKEVYKEWFKAGAHRYLLRIEVSNPNLYKIYHPDDSVHSYHNRLKCLYYLKEIGYQTGTGVMIGLPFQKIEDLADDLLFFREIDIDMVGMGPYIEHSNTPLYKYRKKLLSLKERIFLSFKMIAVLRLLMPDINIAATTALQAIDPMGREKAIKIGANVIMPNITPGYVRKNYFLYENKPCSEENSEDCLPCLINRLKIIGAKVALEEWGDSKHYFNRLKKQA